MRLFLLLSTLCFLTSSYGQEKYIVKPRAFYYYSLTYDDTYEKNVYATITDYNVEKFSIYKDEARRENLYGKIEKPNFWTRAYTFTQDMKLESQHHAYFLSPGCLSDSMKEFQIVDKEKKPIGLIQGSWSYAHAAEFYFFDVHSHCFCKAVISKDYSSLTLSTPDDQVIYQCEKTLKFDWIRESKVEYYWTVEKVNTISFDERFLWPFIGFVADVWWE